MQIYEALLLKMSAARLFISKICLIKEQGMKVVIIGGGTAGMAAATHLRRKDENAEIIVLEKSNEFATATCGLPYLLSGVIKSRDELTGATVEQMKQVFRIDVRLEQDVVNIDRQKRLLTIDGHEGISYDKLVLATGALQLRPDIPGVLGDNIFTIRDLHSVERIRDYYYGTNAQKVLILGGGDIGVEAAEAFIGMGAAVSMVENNVHVLPTLDYDMAVVVQNHLRDKNVHLYLNRKVREFREDEAVLDDGTTLPFDLVIVATGTRPDVKLPVMADIEIGASGGIVVNEKMQTNDENIYACGDNVEVLNLVTGVKERTSGSSIAIKQARIAADNISGSESRFTGAVPLSISKVFDLMSASVGANEAMLLANNIDYRKVHLFQFNHAAYLPNASQNLYKLLFSPKGKILGVQGVGKDGVDTRINVITEIIRKGGTYRDLIDAQIAYTPAFSNSKDAVNNLGSLAEGVLRDKVRYVYPTALDWTKVGSEIMMIDIRSPQSFKAGHIARAVNLPLATLRENLGSIPRNKQVILYCNYGYGAYNAYCILVQRGFDNVYLLSGSMDLYLEIALDEEA